MPSRASRGTPASSRRSRPSALSSSLPTYEPPTGVLTSKAMHDLSTLPIRHDLSGLHSRLDVAHEHLASIAADMNELVTQRRAVAAARAAKGAEADPEAEAEREELFRRVTDMTGKIEEEVRNVVDRQARMELQEDTLRELSTNVPGRGARSATGAGGPARTQTSLGMTQSQATNMAEGEENEEEQQAESLLEKMRTKLGEAETKYASLSMRERYSAHNSYVNFRRMLHSSQYPDDAAAPPVPHANTWFDEAAGQPLHLGPASSDASNEATTKAELPPGTQNEEDSDIEAVAERTSIRCPLTLLPMKEPVTSTKCPHSFEKEAIHEIIDGNQRRGRGSPKEAKCPVCEVMLTLSDLRPDPTLQRKIARIQAAEARRAAAAGDEEDDDDDEGRRALGAQEITSSSPVHTPRSSKIVRMKRERLSGVQRNH